MIDKKSKARIFNFIRLSFRQSEIFNYAKELSVHPTIKGPRGGKRYTCSKCKMTCTDSEIEVDHIDPIVPIGIKKLDMQIEDYVNKLYCSQSNLQVLCEDCHKDKTNSERKIRLEKKRNGS